ncbi:MAG: hypothetical protein ACXACY_26110, partial [Candidatus Hodarchaeales archaeon]
MAQEIIDVSAFDDSRTPSWGETGTTPYLDAQDGTSFISTTTKKAESGDYQFENTTLLGATDTINSVTFYIYGEDAGGPTDVAIWLSHDNGGAFTEYALSIGTTTQYYSLDVTAQFTTKARLDAAELYVKKANTADAVSFDHAYLDIDYTAGSSSSS